MAAPPESGHFAHTLTRERLIDLEARLDLARRKAFAVLGAAVVLSIPWIGPWVLVPLVLAILAAQVGGRGMARSARPERWIAVVWTISPAMTAAFVALTGGLESPALPAFAMVAVTLGTRFERTGVLFGTVYSSVLLLLVAVVPDPGAALAAPHKIIFPLAIMIAVTLLSAAVVQSDREHRRVAVVDPLTGLLNRTALAQRIAELEEQARQSFLPVDVGLIVADIDHFKLVNDEHGHAVGDAVLKDVSYAMRKALRAFDLVYRIGGEEFVVLLPGADVERATELAERLRAAVAEATESGHPVTMSFGLALGQAPGLDFEALFARADAALYAAKRGGRDQVRAADGSAAPLTV